VKTYISEKGNENICYNMIYGRHVVTLSDEKIIEHLLFVGYIHNNEGKCNPRNQFELYIRERGDEMNMKEIYKKL